MTAPKLPDTERGDPGNIQQSYTIEGTRRYEAASTDPNADWRFPLSIEIAERMSKTDGKIAAVLRAITLPLSRARWDLITDGVRPEVVQRVREDLGLPAPGEQTPRKRASKIVWTEHLREALRALVYGFSVFEQVYVATEGESGREVHLKKLAPRLPTTIERIFTAPDGGLEAVAQKPPEWALGRWTPIILPVDRVCVYSHEREGADWYGTSLLRPAYRDWLVKDELIRINAQVIERNGMGIPFANYADESQRDAAEKMVEDWRAGATAGGVAPLGVTMQLLGVTGSTHDALPTIREHDQNIAKAVLAMFLDLGHDAGARSLGDTFVDLFTRHLQNTADWIAATATEHIVRDLVDHAFGSDEPHPIITPGDLASDQGDLTAQDMKMYVDAGVIQVDKNLEKFIRHRRGLPEAGPRPLVAPPTQPAPVAVPVVPSPGEPVPVGVPDAPLLSDADRATVVEKLRRLTATPLAKIKGDR